MNVVFYTSCVGNYVARAHILRNSIKRFFPDAPVVLCYSDAPARNPHLDTIFDEVISLAIDPQMTKPSWIFRHNIIEICTAIKGPAAKYLLNKYQPDVLIYLDPDTRLFTYPEELMSYLQIFDIVLTPHMTRPSSRARMNIELACQRHGAYNLGFLALRNTPNGHDFADWWADRLKSFCRIDIGAGMFTDQKLVDLAPCFFDGLRIMRETNYNVATWNLEHRVLSRHNGLVSVDGRPLRFYHFAGSPGDRGLTNLKNWFPAKAPLALQLWDEYEKEMSQLWRSEYDIPWSYANFRSGTKITDEMRIHYRNTPKLHKRFPNPFATDRDSFESYWMQEKAE